MQIMWKFHKFRCRNFNFIFARAQFHQAKILGYHIKPFREILNILFFYFDYELLEKLHYSIFTFFFLDRKSTRLNSSHVKISYAVFCLKKKIKNNNCYYRTIQTINFKK